MSNTKNALRRFQLAVGLVPVCLGFGTAACAVVDFSKGEAAEQEVAATSAALSAEPIAQPGADARAEAARLLEQQSGPAQAAYHRARLAAEQQARATKQGILRELMQMQQQERRAGASAEALEHVGSQITQLQRLIANSDRKIAESETAQRRP